MLDLSQVGVKLDPKVAEDIWDSEFGKTCTLTMFSLSLSYIGARVCYHSGDPLDITEELKEPGRAFRLLRNCLRAGHHSVFAHTPVVVPRRQIDYGVFKAFRLGRRYLFNLRHFTEVIPEKVENGLFKFFERESIAIPVFHDLTTPELRDLGISIKLHRLPVEVETGTYWWCVLIDGMSRCCSHQFVRHTTLNFNQRSHRYTEVQEVLVPPSARGKEGVDSFIQSAEWIYRDLVAGGVPKEDARYLYPHGVRTVLLASGPNFLFKDFVEKRSHKKAQWEIRAIANALAPEIQKEEENEV